MGMAAGTREVEFYVADGRCRFAADLEPGVSCGTSPVSTAVFGKSIVFFLLESSIGCGIMRQLCQDITSDQIEVS